MTDEEQIGSYIEYDDTSSEGESSDVEKHLELRVNDFLGGSDTGYNTYLNVGAWSTTNSIVSDGAFADVALADITKDTATGDDLLIAFLNNTFLDDSRSRYRNPFTDGDDEADENTDHEAVADNVAVPGVDYSAFAKPPGYDDIYDDSTHTVHESANGTYYYDEALRSALTENIPKYVGWRDHTEGHRITTTRGDKIEVIGGNYKLIVLGRGSGTVHTDWSGGHVVDTLEAAGNVTSINWRQVPVTSGDTDEQGWKWVEEVVKGNVIERFHGSMKTEIYGEAVVSIIGSDDEDNIRDLEKAIEDEDLADEDDRPGHWAEVDDYEEGENFWDETLADYSSDEGIPTRSRPRIYERIYAKSIYSHEHVTGAKVDIENVAGMIDDYRGCEPSGDVDSEFEEDAGFVYDLAKSDSYFSDDDRAVFKAAKLKKSSPADGPRLLRTTEVAEGLREHTITNTFVEERDCDLYLGNYQAADGFGTHVIENWYGNVFENFMGARESVFVGPNVSVTVGATVDFVAPIASSFCLGLNYEVRAFTTKTVFMRTTAAVSKLHAELKTLETRASDLSTTAASAKNTLTHQGAAMLVIRP